MENKYFPVKRNDKYERPILPKNGTNKTIKGFKSRAFNKWPCSNWYVALNEPQPGQYRPVIRWNGHGGKKDVSAGFKTNSGINNKTNTELRRIPWKHLFFSIYDLPLKTLHAPLLCKDTKHSNSHPNNTHD